MRPLAEWPLASRRGIRAVLTDIDDTLTHDGKLPAIAYAALERLHDAGLLVIPVTGRPAGWCDLIARFWPVDAVIGENGALYMRYDRAERQLHRRFHLSEAEQHDAQHRLRALGQRILHDVPGTALAADQPYRACDLAIDFCEDVAPLPDAAISRIVDLCEAAGATAKVSSIHVNAWFGSWNKLTMAKRLFADEFALDFDAIDHAIAYAGDSPNDAPMFAAVPNGVGVANVLRFRDRMDALPAWVTPSEGGAGFAELADALLAARQAQGS